MKNNSILQRIFNHGFRPLFLLAGLHAVVSVPLWALYWSGNLTFDLQRAGSLFHGHELISGLVAAAIGGFLLTAVANWTQRPPISGPLLALLCGVWCLGRVVFNQPALAAATDLGYWALLTGLIARELIQAGNRRNYKILVVLLSFLLSDAAYHVAELDNQVQLLQQVVWFQILLTVLLINLIGGRIIPAFTGNWLKMRAIQQQHPQPTLPPMFNRLDLLASLALLLFMVLLFLPDIPETIQACGAGIACVLQLLRISRWKLLQTGSEPLIWMMHLAYLWIPMGLGLWALALIGLLPIAAAVHALASGTVAGMIMAVSSRAILGHTGRPLTSPVLLTLAVLLLSGATILRILAAVSDAMTLLWLSTILWTLAFAVWLVCFSPLLMGKAPTI